MKLPKELRDKIDIGGPARTHKCSVNNCGENAIRSLSENAWMKYIEKSGLKLKDKPFRRLYLCKEHYYQSNKVRKSQEKIFQKKGFLDNSSSSKKGKWEI
jgi:hypothetical protein